MATLLTTRQISGLSKHTGKKLKTLMASTALAAVSMILFAANTAVALPSGEQVVGGDVSYERDGSTLNAYQATDRAYTLWDSFNTDAHETVNIFQPGANSLSVNKVIGGSIEGTIYNGVLNSNGNVWILDQNGVFFGDSARIDVGGILATTGDITINDVMDGDDHFEFSHFGNGKIVNAGTMTVAEGGLVAFVGSNAANNGVVNARLGKVSFAAGDKVTLDMYGDGLFEIAVEGELADALLENTDTINAEGGTVQMTALAAKDAVDNIINMDGIVNVASATVQGGKIILSGGSQGTVAVNGDMDASGKTGGGTVSVTGQNVKMNGSILADAMDNGHGGTVNMTALDTAILNGYVSAQGGVFGGNGGAVELSGADMVGIGENALVNTRATNGLWGSFLIDPAEMTLYNGPDALPGFINADTLGLLLSFSDILLGATDAFHITDNVDISEADFDYNFIIPFIPDIHIHEIATGNLTLIAPTVNVGGNIIIGQGGLNIIADTTNLNGSISSRDVYHGATQIVTDEARLGGLVSTINVQSNKAKINQAMNFMADIGADKTINVAAGTYDEAVVLDKNNVALRGVTGATLNVGAGQTGVLVDASGSQVSGFKIDGGLTGIQLIDSHNALITTNTLQNITGMGIWVDPSNNVEVAHNTINNIGGDAILVDLGMNAYIHHNTVNNTGGDGIDVNDNSGVRIETNTISGVFGNGIDVSNSPGAHISENIVSFIVNNGIIVQNSDNVTVEDNAVFFTGDGINADHSHGLTVINNVVSLVAGDGIDIEDSMNVFVDHNQIFFAGENGIELRYSTDATVKNNIVAGTLENGIFVEDGAGLLVDGNMVSMILEDGIHIEGFPGTSVTPLATISNNTIIETHGDGIEVSKVGNSLISGNTINNTTQHGIFAAGIGETIINGNNTVHGAGADGVNLLFIETAEISGNTFTDNGDDGIDASLIANLTINGNTLSGNADNGAEVSNVVTTEVIQNQLNNNGAHGLFIKGANNQFVTLFGNGFTDNTVQARFESGKIDLTGQANVFNGGDIALQFIPAPINQGGFASMELAGNTIGLQFFNGQRTYFVELDNSAFFDPGIPTILDALDSLFVTPFGIVRPSDTDDLIGADVSNFLESKFFHFVDRNNLGLFFFGNIPNPEIDQEDIFRRFGTFGPFDENISFTLNGLPFVDPALALSALAPAAGNNEEGTHNVRNMSEIEPASGEGNNENSEDEGGGNVHCWADAVATAGAGARVNYSFGTGLDDALSDAASCEISQL